MGTMGDTTSRNLAGLVRAANSGGGAGVNAPVGGKYYGGFAGGGGGTFGKAPSGRGEPQAAGSSRGGGATGVRPKIRPNSEGVKALWDTLPAKELPHAPAKGGHGPSLPQRPQTAPRPKPRPLSALEPVEYQLSGAGLTANRALLASRPLSALPAEQNNSHHNVNSRPRTAAQHPDALPPYASPYSVSSGARKSSAEAVMSMLESGLAPSGFADTLPLARMPSASAGLRIHNERGAEADTPAPGGGGEHGAELPTSASMAADLKSAENVMVADILRLEDAMRAALKKRRTVYEDERQLLQKLFKSVDDGSGDVDADEFVSLMRKLGVALRRSEAIALFRRYGHHGRTMPYTAFAKMLLTDKSRQLATDVPLRKGAFVLGDGRGGRAACKVAYHPAKNPVHTPSDWDEAGSGDAVIARSGTVPDSRLKLEFVYGYAGVDNAANNVFYNCERNVVYYVAGLCVVYTPPPSAGQDVPAGNQSHTQHFFLEHDDDIKSLAVCAAATQVDGKAYPPNALFASGQVSSHEHGPYVCIWDSQVASQSQGSVQLRRLEFPKSDRGITALGFSPDGRYLTVVVMDNTHSVFVYDWLNSRRVCEGRGYCGEPPQVYGVTWNPHTKHSAFATWGKKHCKLWSEVRQADGGAAFQATQLSFGKLDVQNVHAAAFLPHSHTLVLGVARGDIVVFEGTTAARSIQAHRPGPQFVDESGACITYGGVRGLVLRSDNAVLLSAGADGVVNQWDVKDGVLNESKRRKPIVIKPAKPSEKPPVFRALASCPADESRGHSGPTTGPPDNSIVLGTASCDIWKVDGEEQVRAR